MPLIPLDCPFCGANLTVESSKDAAICEFCGKPYIVKDAIVHNYINNVTNITADTVNVYSQKDFTIKAGVLEKYNGESVDIVIPDNVNTIGKRAFENLEIETVIVPKSVKCVCAGAFYMCQNLKSVTLLSNDIKFEWLVREYSDIREVLGPFQDCINLVKINIPKNLEHICDYMFSGCKNLQQIIIPENMKEIGCCAFMECVSLSSIELPNSITQIGSGAFSGCVSLSSIVIPDSVTQIGNLAFQGCRSLSEVTIPDSVTRIGCNVFMDCSNPLSLSTSVGTFEINPNCFGSESSGKYVSFEDMKKKYLMEQNRCTFCGGDFSGLIIKKCSKCGKTKV